MAHIAPWFPKSKFGIFIHWTLKCLPLPPNSADKDHREVAREQAKGFTASKFDAEKWGKTFASWGAKYAVLTTKHHIGFSLYDCSETRFSAKNSSPAARDLVQEFVEGMRKAGLKVGIYFSLPDWSHPDYASLSGGDNPKVFSKEDQPERWNRFIKDMMAEIRHLCTAYGKIDMFWFDGDWERSVEQWHSEEISELIQELQPHAIINNRLRHPYLGHFGSPESNAPIFPRNDVWEYCTTPGENWDGAAASQNVKPPHELVRNFADVLQLGGNMLLNVAPNEDGTIPKEQTGPLEKIGHWIASHGKAIYNTQGGLPAGLFNGASSIDNSVLYLFAYDIPRDELVVKGLQSQVSRITHLQSGKELEWRRSGGRESFGKKGWLFIKLPAELMEEYAAVVKVEFENDELKYQTPGGIKTHRGRPSLEEKDLAGQRG